MHKSSLKSRAVRAEVTAVAGTIVILLVQAAHLGVALEYRRDALSAEPWRLVTGHWTHLGWMHAILNCVGWLAMSSLFWLELRAPRQLLILALSSLLIGGAFVLLEPDLEWYRGMSGVLHALFCAGAVLWIRGPEALNVPWMPWLLLAGAWVKVLVEATVGIHFSSPSWLSAPVVTHAHLYGAVFGTLLGYALARVGGETPASRAERGARAG